MSHVKVVVLTLTFSTVSISGTLKPRPGCAVHHGAVAQQHGALGLIDRVPASRSDNADDDDGDDGADNSPVHSDLSRPGS